MSVVFSDLSTCEYDTPGHPESPKRVSKSHKRLRAAGLIPQIPAIQATEADVRLMHSENHFAEVRDGRYSDMDTPHYPGIEKIALTSLSGAISSALSAAEGKPAFSLMRPPGHHAGRNRVAGFCYFNNIAIACQRLVAEKKAARIGILDIDVHHGDGTEELMTGRDDVLFVSLHQMPLYPGTGAASHDNILNVPLPPLTAEADFLKALESSIGKLLDFKPAMLAVSAGFDTYKECPIAQMKLEKITYRRIGEMIASTKAKRFAVLEGGYASDLPILIENFLTGFF